MGGQVNEKRMREDRGAMRRWPWALLPWAVLSVRGLARRRTGLGSGGRVRSLAKGGAGVGA